MKNGFTLCACLILLAGCRSQPPGERPVEAGPAPAAEEARAVEMNEAAQRDARLEVAEVAAQSLPVTIAANGRITNNENTTWRVGAITDGRMIRVAAKPGDQVVKGQILARMHSHDIHEARAEYRTAIAEQTRAQANLDFARKQLDRLRRLFEMKAASLEQVEQAENELKNAQTVLANATNELSRTRLHLVEFLDVPAEGPEEHGHSADPEAHIDDLIPIRAPETGIVLTRLVTQGAVVSAASDLFVISNLSSLWAMAAVQEQDLAKLRTGMPARLRVQAYPDRIFAGRVGKVDEKLDAETRTVQVRVDLENRQGLLKPEMYATVELDAGGSQPALLIPQEGVQDINGQPTVFVQTSPTRFEPRPVELGRPLRDRVQVLRGLRGGERVVGQGSFILKSQYLKSAMSEE